MFITLLLSVPSLLFLPTQPSGPSSPFHHPPPIRSSFPISTSVLAPSGRHPPSFPSSHCMCPISCLCLIHQESQSAVPTDVSQSSQEAVLQCGPCKHYMIYRPRYRPYGLYQNKYTLHTVLLSPSFINLSSCLHIDLQFVVFLLHSILPSPLFLPSPSFLTSPSFRSACLHLLAFLPAFASFLQWIPRVEGKATMPDAANMVKARCQPTCHSPPKKQCCSVAHVSTT